MRAVSSGTVLEQGSGVRGSLMPLEWEPQPDPPPSFPALNIVTHSLVTQSCLTKLCVTILSAGNLGIPVHEISQARILERFAMPSSRGSSQPRDRTQVSCIASRVFTAEQPGKPVELP